MDIDEREERVLKEQRRITRLFKDIPPNKKKVVEGLIVQAARLRIMLDDAWDDINENGDVELFQQSPNVEPYERERPVAKLFNARDGAYQKIMKQLSDLVPDTQLPGGNNKSRDLL